MPQARVGVWGSQISHLSYLWKSLSWYFLGNSALLCSSQADFFLEFQCFQNSRGSNLKQSLFSSLSTIIPEARKYWRQFRTAGETCGNPQTDNLSERLRSLGYSDAQTVSMVPFYLSLYVSRWYLHKLHRNVNHVLSPGEKISIESGSDSAVARETLHVITLQTARGSTRNPSKFWGWSHMLP